MTVFRPLVVAIALLFVVACGHEGGKNDSSGATLLEDLECQRPCVKLRLYATAAWEGPPHPNGSIALGGVACHSGDGAPGPYRTSFEFDPGAGVARFSCDGKGGLHLSGRLTRAFADAGAPAEGVFGADSSLVLSATGPMAEQLASVIDPAGTDLWPLFEAPRRWYRSETGLYSYDPPIGYLPVGADQSIRDSPKAWFETEILLPTETEAHVVGADAQ